MKTQIKTASARSVLKRTTTWKGSGRSFQKD